MYILIAIVFVTNYHSYKIDIEWNKTEFHPLFFCFEQDIRFYVEMNEK